jgi:hypothetical protein
LAAGGEVPEPGYDLEDVVDGVAAAAALMEYLPVFEAGDHVLDAGFDASVCPAVVATDGAPVAIALRRGDGRDGAVAEDDALPGE